MNVMTLENALRPLAAIADAFDSGQMDCCALRPQVKPESIALVSSTDGRCLMTARDALDARAALISGDGLDAVAGPLVAIARAFDANALDGDAWNFRGDMLAERYEIPTTEITLVAGRGGRRLLTLEDALEARAARAQARDNAKRAD